jgi:hypothetical protein
LACNRLGIEYLESRRLLATIPVTLAVDAQFNTDTDNGITLREAVRYINGEIADPGDLALIDFSNGGWGTNDTIVFDLPMGVDTIDLDLGEIGIERSVTIDGTDGNGVSLGITIDANNGSRIFNIDSGLSVTQEIVISGLTFTRGNTIDAAGGGAIASRAA